MQQRNMRVQVLVGVVVGLACFGVANCSSGSGSGVDYVPQPGGGTTGGNTGGGGGTPSVDSGTPVADGGTNLTVTRRNLAVDSPDAGFGTNPPGVPSPRVDSILVNPWGLATTTAQTIWVANNGTGEVSAFNPNGDDVIPSITVPTPAGSDGGEPAKPTGLVWNTDGTQFMGDTFIFVTEDGTIAGWQGGAKATIRVDNSAKEAKYKGVALLNGRLFATNFHAGEVDVFDAAYQAVGSFKDPGMEAGFAPFGVANIDGVLYVSFAKQDADKEDDVHGPGNGFIDTFDPATGEAKRLISKGALNSPWGMAKASSSFGALSGMLLVGNFGDGTVHAFDPASGAELGGLVGTDGKALKVDGLWGLAFGMDADGGTNNTLYFTAGPNEEKHGVFGTFTPVVP